MLILCRAAQAYHPSLRSFTSSYISHAILVSDSKVVLRRQALQSLTATSSSDIFWTFSESLYNSIYKIVFVASSAYTVYLMLNDYKPTHDPNIDTFKVQYLLGGSAVLAILIPYKYTFTEVHSTAGKSLRCADDQSRSYGHSQSGWNPSQFCRSSSCFKERGRQKQSQHTTSLPWGSTGRCISRTGFTDTLLRDIGIR